MVEWCAIIYDKKGSDRSQFRAQHLVGIPPLVEQGKFVCAGAIYNDDGSFAGSHLQIVADSKDEALSIINADIFAKEGIWDLDSLIIYNFGCAVRIEKQ